MVVIDGDLLLFGSQYLCALRLLFEILRLETGRASWLSDYTVIRLISVTIYIFFGNGKIDGVCFKDRKP